MLAVSPLAYVAVVLTEVPLEVESGAPGTEGP